MAKQNVTNLNSPFAVSFPKDSDVLGDESFNVDFTSGSGIVQLPALADLGGALNQKVVLTNLTAIAAKCYPATADKISDGAAGVGFLVAAGKTARLQPANDGQWSVFIDNATVNVAP